VSIISPFRANLTVPSALIVIASPSSRSPTPSPKRAACSTCLQHTPRPEILTAPRPPNPSLPSTRVRGCGGRLIIIETFQRDYSPRYHPVASIAVIRRRTNAMMLLAAQLVGSICIARRRLVHRFWATKTISAAASCKLSRRPHWSAQRSGHQAFVQPTLALSSQRRVASSETREPRSAPGAVRRCLRLTRSEIARNKSVPRLGHVFCDRLFLYPISQECRAPSNLIVADAS
jgi:hypothetical protein